MEVVHTDKEPDSDPRAALPVREEVPVVRSEGFAPPPEGGVDPLALLTAKPPLNGPRRKKSYDGDRENRLTPQTHAFLNKYGAGNSAPHPQSAAHLDAEDYSSLLAAKTSDEPEKGVV